MEYVTDPKTLGLAAVVASATAAYKIHAGANTTGSNFKPLGIATLVAVVMLVIWVIISRTTALAKNKVVARWGSHIDWALGGLSAGFGSVLIARGGQIAAIWGEAARKNRGSSTVNTMDEKGNDYTDL